MDSGICKNPRGLTPPASTPFCHPDERSEEGSPRVTQDRGDPSPVLHHCCGQVQDDREGTGKTKNSAADLLEDILLGVKLLMKVAEILRRKLFKTAPVVLSLASDRWFEVACMGSGAEVGWACDARVQGQPKINKPSPAGCGGLTKRHPLVFFHEEKTTGSGNKVSPCLCFSTPSSFRHSHDQPLSPSNLVCGIRARGLVLGYSPLFKQQQRGRALNLPNRFIDLRPQTASWTPASERPRTRITAL